MSADSRSGVGAPAPLFLVSASILLLETYWLRALAEAEWGHVASMVVSTAMLGIGAGGALIFVLADRPTFRPDRAWRDLLLIFPFLAGTAPLVADLVPFDPLLLFWRTPAWLWLVLRELAIAGSFAAGAAAVALAFRERRHSPGRLYATNLLGATAGVAAALILMAARPCGDLLRAAVATAALAAALTVSTNPGLRLTATVLGLFWAFASGSWSAPRLAETKDLALALRLPEAAVLADRPGLPGRWTVVGSPALHFAPGLSLVRSEPLPPQRALFLRGDGRGAVYQRTELSALRHRIAWLPYEVRPPASVLVLGDGSILELQAAKLAGARRIVGVIPDFRTREALGADLGRFAGIDPAEIEIRADGARAALARLGEGEAYDLVVLTPDDSLESATAGLASGLESNTLTVESLTAALLATTPRGQVTVQRWTQAPPRDLPKLLAIFVRAFRNLGIGNAYERLALVQHWDAWTLCASRTPYDPAERTRLAEFARSHGFDVLLPERAEGGFLHELPGPAIGPLLDEILAGFIPETYPFQIAPATDDQPYFHHFLSYRHLGRYLDEARTGSIAVSDWGDLFLWVSLASAALLGGLLVVAPALSSSQRRRVLRCGLADTALFGCLGLGYMLFEVLLIHHGTRLLGETTLAATIVLLAFLLGSGIGAAALPALGETGSAGPLAALVAALAAWTSGMGLEPLFNSAFATPAELRWTVLFIPALVLALPLGIPFPAGLARFGRDHPERIPWFVAVNGWFSVIGAILATILAIALGFRGLAVVVACLYAAAFGLLSRRPT